MEGASVERQSPRSEAQGGAARRRAIVETYARNEAALRRTARRYSLCEDDADDALQRGLEILLRKAPSSDPRELIKWTQTVVKHEALAIRAERERILPPPRRGGGEGASEDWLSLLPSTADGPAERAEREEAVDRSREALRALKPQELRALTLLAQGYSYAEIGEITTWSQTKINRCLAEGRERFRRLISSSEDGRRCAELGPLISAFCDGEAEAGEAARLREHLRACAHCRATVRAYRAAPAAAAALAPLLPLHRSLWERAHDALVELGGRLRGGGRAEAVGHVTSGGGAGVAGLAKVVAVCIGTASGAAACVAAGLVPAPFGLGAERPQPARLERQASPQPATAAMPLERPRAPGVEPAPGAAAEPKPAPQPSDRPRSESGPAEPAPAPAEPAPESTETAGGEAAEYVPPPEPPPAPAPVPVESTGGDPAGEFGP